MGEDNLVLEAANIYGRNDYQKIIQHVENRMFQLPLLTKNFYRTSKFAQKRERVYRRLKQLIDSRKTIEDKWIPARVTNVTAPTATVPRMSATSTVVREIEKQDSRYLYSMQETGSNASPMSIVAASRTADIKYRKEAEKRKREEQEDVDTEEDQPKKRQR
ncbi:uncharacterized protein LOC116290873 [Actinia tenebrosa]|uniref:Uncharacterized protein LOC116290873 n=1 Tax=Actinia tenebrosa TaxID=6105 RepID=A0A6P8HBQ6_ACTTE|nr:uncharacterized protein LOC116290873 [Actinia tenebrosa]